MSGRLRFSPVLRVFSSDWELSYACGGRTVANEVNNRSLAALVNEVKDEIKEFVQTRLQMLRSEINEKMRSFKAAAPMLAAGVVFLLTAYLLLTVCLVSRVLVGFFEYPYRWFLLF